jgi:hypothetical protein
MDMLDLPDKKLVTTVNTVLTACRAAFKKGLVDAIADVCPKCDDGDKPAKGLDQRLRHGSRLCRARRIHERLEAAGGWSPEGK